MCELLLQELKGMVVDAVLPAAQLPAAYFANLCRQVLRDVEPSLLEMARLKAKRGQPESITLQLARDKGWLTIWRLLALLQHDRFPPGIIPERLDRALGYALAELDQERYRQLNPTAGEMPLPEVTAVRFHQLAGRLMQLNWHHYRERTLAALALLYAEAALDCGVDITPLAPPPSGADLLVNYLPLQPLAGTTVAVARACLAGLALLNVAQPTHASEGVTTLPADCKPRRIAASFSQLKPPTPIERRRRLTALRQPWPYRRFQFAGTTPSWLWDALHVAGLVDAEGVLQLTLPAAWSSAAGAELLWRSLTERLQLAKLIEHGDGRQTLLMVGARHAPDLLELRQPDGSSHHFPALRQDTPLVSVAALAQSTPVDGPAFRARRKQRAGRVTAQHIAALVFRDGLPKFPDQYLRRFDLPSLRAYEIPGPLHAGAPLLDHVRLSGTDGTSVEADNPVDAEALLLASCNGRRRVELPTDPVLTARLIAAYRDDLQRLWQALLTECRRHRTGQRQALAMARRLWRERTLPAPGTSDW
jgi:hypothetical protein